MEFVGYCDPNKILLAVHPPHSTRALQPLDVALFKPQEYNGGAAFWSPRKARQADNRQHRKDDDDQQLQLQLQKA